MPLVDVSSLLNLVLIILLARCLQRRWQRLFKQLWQTWRQYRPQRWKPQSSRECPHCQAGLKLQVLRCKSELRPYRECKNRRGRKQVVSTGGFACPQLGCAYHGVTDDSLHALVGYGRHNGIQRFKCQTCTKVYCTGTLAPESVQAHRGRWKERSTQSNEKG